MLADAIARMPDDHSIILAGHSLGARVIFYALLALSTRKTKKVKNVILAGGAVSKTDITGWENALEAVSGKIYNFYTDKDKILKYAYKTANAFQSEPIGLGPINSTDDNIININCSKIIHKHSEWKTSINSMLPEQIF
jgi:pimeloyl-ACP methyl ester carboxylesterase